MIRIKTGRRFRLIAFFMSFIILLACLLPIAMSGRADSNKVIYFDTSGVADQGSTHDWSKGMSTVYYYAFNSSGNSGIQPMTSTGKPGRDGGILHSASISSNYTTIIFLSVNHWKHSGSDDYRWQTINCGIPSDTSSKVFILEGGYNDHDTQPGVNMCKQKVVTRTKPAETNHNNEKFSLLNMTNSSVTLYIRFSYDIRNSDGTWTDVYKTKSNFETVPMLARTYYYNRVVVPNVSDPYTAVEIWHSLSDTEPIKKYYFDDPEKKILGNGFTYGLTQFSDDSVLSFYEDKKPSTNAVSGKLYLSDASFETGQTPTVAGVATTAMTTGNAHYVTNSNISVSAFTAPTGDAARTIDLSSQIFSVVYNGNTYNLFGPKKDGDDLICINKNVATVVGTYTVQSTDNILIEGGNTYRYITTQADFYDYQYDHNSSSDSSYSYKYDKDCFLAWTNSLNWNGDNICAYFYNENKTGNDKTVGDGWPGTKMTYWKKNEYNQDVYKVDIPKGATHVIFNANGAQTVDIEIGNTTNRGYYGNGTDSNGKYYVTSYSITNSKTHSKTHSSVKGNAKRPYLAINEKISASAYAATATNYPMYLGQFWLPLWNNDPNYDESKEAYCSSTTGQRAAHNNDGDCYVGYGRKPNEYAINYGFGNELTNFNWSANLAYRYQYQPAGAYKPYNGVVQGLVNKQLENSEYLKSNSGSQYIPYFDMRTAEQGGFWTGNFTTSQGTTAKMAEYIVKAENRAFPFFETDDENIQFKNGSELNRGHKTGTTTQMLTDTGKNYTGTYYVFDSSKNTVRVNGDSLIIGYNDSTKQVKDNYGAGTDGNGEEIGLFPFNENSDGGHDSEKLHYGFGVKFSIDFYLNDNGTLDGTAGGTPITFTFQGDDDVWVFLDDQLVLDMGGAHKNAVGEINFANKKVYIDSGTTVNTGNLETASALGAKDQSFSEFNSTLTNNSEYLKSGKHKITMYYLERGMLNSNLYIMFNLPMSLTKWELQEDTDFSNVNSAFVNATKAVANQDVFNYKVENAGTKNVVGSDYKYPSNAAVTRTNSEASSTYHTTTLSSSSTNTAGAQAYNFKGSNGTAYVPLIYNDSGGGVSYGLRDMFAGNNTAIFRTRTVGSNQGVVSLQYGELATFSKQFNYQTAMRVTQLEKLSAPESNNTRVTDAGADSYNDSTGRTSSKYYTTYWRPVSTASDYTKDAGIYRGDDIAGLTIQNASGIDHANMYDSLVTAGKNYSMNSVVNLQPDGLESTYSFNDPEDGANEYVHLRQVVINKVKTAELTISKRNRSESTDTTTYNFTIHFSNIFGSNLGDSLLTVTSINYFKNGSNTGTPLGSNGSFSLKPGDYITIGGIPVGTKFYITEQSNSSDTYVLDESMSVNLGSSTNPVEITDDTESVAMNARKTGKFAISKILYGTDGTEQIKTDTTQFTLTVTLTQPSGVNLSDYIIMVNGLPVVLTQVTGETDKYTFTTQITGGQSFYVNGLPYGTVYSVTEGDPPSGYKKHETDHMSYTDSAKTIGNTTQETDTVTVKNQLNPIVMPSTGGTPLILLFPFGIIAIVISAGALVIYKKRLQYKTVIK